LRTFESDLPEQCAHAAQTCGAVAVGANCGRDIGMADMVEIVRRYRRACDLPIFVKANAGTPVWTEAGCWCYPRTPDAMAAELPGLLAEGIAMIGGCCGTTPAHIRALRKWVAKPKSEPEA
jgi:methionine synthase I (cobalamin-dependent)